MVSWRSKDNGGEGHAACQSRYPPIRAKTDLMGAKLVADDLSRKIALVFQKVEQNKAPDSLQFIISDVREPRFD